MKKTIALAVAAGFAAGVLAPVAAQDVPSPAQAQPAATDARAQLEARKREQTALFDMQEQACSKRFAVTDCVSEVNVRRRAVVAVLRKEENALNELERRQREQAHLQSLQERARQRAEQAPWPVNPDAESQSRGGQAGPAAGQAGGKACTPVGTAGSASSKSAACYRCIDAGEESGGLRRTAKGRRDAACRA